MKLLIILSVITFSYAEKLDNTYLPPKSAATAGGSPGSLTAPGSQTESGLFNSFGQPSAPTFGQGTSQNVPQSGSPQPGQIVSGQYTPQQYGQSGGLSQTGGPSFASGSIGVNQAEISPVAGSTNVEQGSPGFNQAGSLPSSNRPGFEQASLGYNQAPTFVGQAQVPSEYSGQVQPERARASIDRNAEILRYDNQRDGDSYAYSFETSNGISAEESGVATNGVRAKGSFAYTGDDGQQYRVTYTADENGYLPQGDHLPTPPPIPEEILKSLEENARAAAAGTQEGAYNPNEDFGVGVATQQSSGKYTGQGQPDQSVVSFNTLGQGSTGIAQQGFQNQGPTSQYGSTRYPTSQDGLGSASNTPFGASRTPVTGSPGYPGAQVAQSLSPQNGVAISSPGYQTSSAQGNQALNSQYNVADLSPGITSSSRPQASNADTSRYSASIGSSSGSVMTGQQGLNTDSGYQYNAPGSSSGQGQYQQQYNRPSVAGSSVQGRPSSASQYVRPSGVTGNYQPESQTPVSKLNQFASTYDGSKSPQAAISSRPDLAPQGTQNSGYNYNSPTGSSSVRPLGTGPLNRPQDLSNQNQGQYAQNIFGTQGNQILQQAGKSPSTQYNRPPPSSSGYVRPSGSQGYPSQGNQASQTQSGSNQRPQLGKFGPSGLETQKPSGQGQDNGYQYNRPQNQFSASQTGPGSTRPSGASASLNQFNRPSLGVTASTPTQGTSAFAGNNYAPSGPLSGGPTTPPNVFGSGKPSLSTNQGFSSGPVNIGSAGSAPAVVIGQGSNRPRPGQYPSAGPSTGAIGSTFTRPGISTGGYESTSQYQSGQKSGGSSGYQYVRPSSQSPSSVTGSQIPFNSQPGNGSTFLGQDNSDRVEPQFSFRPSSQDRPDQTGSQSRPSGQTSSQPGYRPSGVERPTENFGGPRQPPSFSPEEGYKY